MRILVTGSEGNIGRGVIPHLRSQGHDILRTDIHNLFAPDYVMADVKRPGDLVSTFTSFEPDVVLHMAAVVSRITAERSPHMTVDTNISGVNNMIMLCKQFDARLVYFSSSEVYGPTDGPMVESNTPHPNNLYGLTKYMGEMLVRYTVENRGLRAMILRPFMLYDENETRGIHRSAMVRFAESLLRGETITVHVGAERSWLHMEDAAEIIGKLIAVDPTFMTINVGNPSVIKMVDLATIMCTHLGMKPDSKIRLEELPPRMTLKKYPHLGLQTSLTDKTDFIPVGEGVRRLLIRMERELVRDGR